MTRDQDIALLREANAWCKQVRDAGNHPFGALLVDAEGKVVLRAGNSFETDKGVGHAETNLAREAARRFDIDYLGHCTLYTTIEPCCICAGTIYWAGISAVVFGATEAALAALTGDNAENPTMDLPCRTVFDAGQRRVEVRGPFPELENELLEPHRGFWRNR